MKRIHHALTLALPILLFAYIAAYGVYRRFGPVEKHWPVESEYPGLVIGLVSPQRVLLYRRFYPCLCIEDAYYRLRYRGTYTPPTSVATSDTDG